MYWYKNLPDVQTFEDIKKRRGLSSAIRRTFVEFLLLMFLLGVAFFLFSGFNYVDVRDDCYIKVKYDVLQGDRGSIIEALKQIKKEDYIFYRNLCQNVTRIYEKKCVLAEKNTPRLKFLPTQGCYIRGSKSIIIHPIKPDEYDKVERRISAIKLYAQMAIDYWASHPQTE